MTAAPPILSARELSVWFPNGNGEACSSAVPAAPTLPQAVRVARMLGPGLTIVTVLCDGGQKYLSRFYNPEWLAQKGLAAYAEAADR